MKIEAMTAGWVFLAASSPTAMGLGRSPLSFPCGVRGCREAAGRFFPCILRSPCSLISYGINVKTLTS